MPRLKARPHRLLNQSPENTCSRMNSPRITLVLIVPDIVQEASFKQLAVGGNFGYVCAISSVRVDGIPSFRAVLPHVGFCIR